jgi:excisionase family DNA binding protein
MTARGARTAHLLTPAGVAALLFVDPKTVSRWAIAGKIPSTRTPGGHRRFLRSDVEALISNGRHQDHLHNEGVSAPPDNGTAGHGGTAPARTIGPAAADAEVAQAVAVVLETEAQAAAETVLETAASVAVAAERAAAAAVKARRARAARASVAAQAIAGEAASAAAAMRALVTTQAACIQQAATQAKRLVGSSGTEAQTSLVAVRMAATVQVAADTVLADSTLAAARVAQAVSKAAAHVAATVSASDLSLEREAAAAAQALHDLTQEALRLVVQRNRHRGLRAGANEG